MRVTTEFWVSALLRRAQSAGAFATVLKKGAASAGAIFIVVRDLGQLNTLFGPAPQNIYDHDGPADRQFEILLSEVSETQILEKLSREKSFDPDIWIIEIEDRQMRNFIETTIGSGD